MQHSHIDIAAHDNALTFCPNCGSDAPDDNYLDERLYAEAAREVPMLRHEGKISEAMEVLSALFARRIVNILRPKFRCRACRAAFD